jgi:hypothetical protein
VVKLHDRLTHRQLRDPLPGFGNDDRVLWPRFAVRIRQHRIVPADCFLQGRIATNLMTFQPALVLPDPFFEMYNRSVSTCIRILGVAAGFQLEPAPQPDRAIGAKLAAFLLQANVPGDVAASPMRKKLVTAPSGVNSRRREAIGSSDALRRAARPYAVRMRSAIRFSRRRCTEEGMRIASRYFATVRRAMSMPPTLSSSTIRSSLRTSAGVSASISCLMR